MSDVTPHEALVLAALSDRPRYGYELVERIDYLTAGKVNLRPGNLYRIIDRLRDRGLARESRPPADAEDVDERRRYFRATPAGEQAAREELGVYAGALRRARLVDG